MNDGHFLGLQQFTGEFLVIGDDLARRRGLADAAGDRWIDVEGAFGVRAGDALGVVQHGDDEIPALLEGG